MTFNGNVLTATIPLEFDYHHYYIATHYNIIVHAYAQPTCIIIINHLICSQVSVLEYQMIESLRTDAHATVHNSG